MEKNEKKLERRLEIFLATADALRKAREIQLELGVPIKELLFPVVWTMSYTFIFFPRSITQSKEATPCHLDFMFEFIKNRVEVISRVTAQNVLCDFYDRYSHMPIIPEAALVFDTSKLGEPLIRPAGNAVHVWTDENEYFGGADVDDNMDSIQESEQTVPSSATCHFGCEGRDPPRWVTVVCTIAKKVVHTPVKVWIVDTGAANDIVAESEVIGMTLKKAGIPMTFDMPMAKSRPIVFVQ